MMKQRSVKWLATPKLCVAVVLGLWLFGSQLAWADGGKWLLVTNEGVKLEMESVGSFVLVDDTETFDVLSTSGSILAAKVKKVVFEQSAMPDAVKSVDASQPQLLSHAVHSQLTILGTQGEAVVYSAGGTKVASGNAKDGKTVIDVARLPQGVYTVQAGKQSFKFIKK